MSTFVVTIRSEDSQAETIVKVDDSNGTPRVTEISVRSTSKAGLSGSQPATIDPESLLRALRLGGAGQRRDGQVAAGAAKTGGAKRTSTAKRTPAGKRAATKRTTAKRTAAKRTTATPTAAKSTPAAKATRGRPRKATTATKATRGRPRKATTAAAESATRVYRRMPDDIAATYASTATITALAKHYGVPRHTAQGWVARLRRQG